MKTQLPILTGGYLGRSAFIDSQRMINLIVEKDNGGKGPIALVNTPGTQLWATIPSTPIRGIYAFDSYLFVVAGDTLYMVDTSKNITSKGTLLTSSGYVSFSDNGPTTTGGKQLMIVDDSYGYIYDLTTSTVTKIADSNFAGFQKVVFLNGHFLTMINETFPREFQQSALYDGTTWSALDKATKETTTDHLVSMITSQSELWLLGTRNSEVWYDTGTGHPTVAKIPGVLIEHGCCAQYSVASGDSSVFWLAQNENGGIYALRSSGYSVIDISTPSIEYTWSQYSDVSDAYGYFISYGGHSFYVLTFPTANATWQYDISTKLWNELSTYDTTNPDTFGRHFGSCFCNFHAANIYLIGDYNSGGIYQLSNDFYYDKDTIDIQRVKSFPYIPKKTNVRNIWDGLEIHMNTDVYSQSSASFSGFLKWSSDGGNTWGNQVPMEMLGKGNYLRRLRVNGLGSDRQRAFWFQYITACASSIVGASGDIRTCRK